MEGRKHDFERVGDFRDCLVIVDLLHDVGQELFVRLHAQTLNQSGTDRVIVRHGFYAVKDVDLFQTLHNGVGVFRGKLRAVLPVDFIAVVLLGVVAGRDVDTRLAVVFPDRETQFGRGAEGLKEADMDAVGGADFSGGNGEIHGVVAAVHANGDAAAFALFALGDDNVGKALRGPADHMRVHLMEAGTHGTAQSGGAELQRGIEPGLNLFGIVFDCFQFRVFFRRQGGAVQPLLVLFHEIHTQFLHYMNFARVYFHLVSLFREAPGLLMILSARADLIRPVNLFQQHDAGQMVRKRHRGEGEFPAGKGFHALMETERAADQENDMAFILYSTGKLFAGNRLPFHTKRNQLCFAVSCSVTFRDPPPDR